MMRMGGNETEQLSYLYCLLPLCVGWRGSREERSGVGVTGVVCPSRKQAQPCGRKVQGSQMGSEAVFCLLFAF